MHSNNQSYIVPGMPDISQKDGEFGFLTQAFDDAKTRIRRFLSDSMHIHVQISGAANNRPYGNACDFEVQIPLFAALQTLAQNNFGPSVDSLATPNSNSYMLAYLNVHNIDFVEKAIETCVFLTDEQAAKIFRCHPMLAGFVKSIYPMMREGAVYDFAFYANAYKLPERVFEPFEIF